MAISTSVLPCPTCGAPHSLEDKVCDHCGNPLTISTFTSVHEMPMPRLQQCVKGYREALAEQPEDQGLNNSVAMCYLKLNMYDKALPAFEKAMEDNFDNSETFFYAAVCLLQGKKAFLHQRPTINKILEYVNTALMIEPRGIYYYFLAYIRQDYFARKYLTVSPDYRQTLAMAKDAGVTDHDISQLYQILGVERPGVL